MNSWNWLNLVTCKKCNITLHSSKCVIVCECIHECATRSAIPENNPLHLQHSLKLNNVYERHEHEALESVGEW